VDFVSSAFVCGGLDQEDWRGCREEELTVGWEGGAKGTEQSSLLAEFH